MKGKDPWVLQSQCHGCWWTLTHCPLGDLNVNLALLIGIFKSYDNILRCMPQDLTDDKSTLFQVMAWCRQATSHYPNQCWLRSPMPYGVTRPQWVKHIPNLKYINIQYFPIYHFLEWNRKKKFFCQPLVNTLPDYSRMTGSIAWLLCHQAIRTILIIWGKHLLIFHMERFQLPTPSYSWVTIKNANLFVCFL